MIRKTAAAFLFLAAAATCALAQTPKTAGAISKSAPVAVEEPRDIVAAIYRLAAADPKKAKPVSPFDQRATREKYFSKSFDLLITSSETKAAHDGYAAIDFDPISASQDAELQKVTLKTDILGLGKAIVSASFLNHGLNTVVTYDFIREDGAWRVDDIKGTTEREAWSVRKILKASGKPPKDLPGMTDAPKAKQAR